MITIYYRGHAQTLDMVRGVASGHFDTELSDYGRHRAATDLRSAYESVAFDAVYTSDTRRAYDTARLMLDGRGVDITQDARLRECDYGDMTGGPRAEVEALRSSHLREPFPNGESYDQVMHRMGQFIDHIARTEQGKTLLIVGHFATYLGLEHIVNGVPVETALKSTSHSHGVYKLQAFSTAGRGPNDVISAIPTA